MSTTFIWFEKQVKPVMRGKSRLIRYADDFVIIFHRKDDAERVKGVLPKRFGKYELTVHPDKTRLVDFRSPHHPERRREAEASDDVRRDGKPGTFDLLGITHYWDKTRKGGQAVKRKTMKSRIARSIHNVDQTPDHWGIFCIRCDVAGIDG